MLGRVFGALQLLSMAGIPFGTALAGFAVEDLGIIATIAGMAVTPLTTGSDAGSKMPARRQPPDCPLAERSS
jgi:hypothetical protein